MGLTTVSVHLYVCVLSSLTHCRLAKDMVHFPFCYSDKTLGRKAT